MIYTVVLPVEIFWRALNAAVASLGGTVFGIIFFSSLSALVWAIKLWRQERNGRLYEYAASYGIPLVGSRRRRNFWRAANEEVRKNSSVLIAVTLVFWTLLMGYYCWIDIRDLKNSAAATPRPTVRTPAIPVFAFAKTM